MGSVKRTAFVACIGALIGAACAPRRPLPEQGGAVAGQTGGPPGGNGGQASTGDGGAGGGADAGGAVAGTGGAAVGLGGAAGGGGAADAGDPDGAAGVEAGAAAGHGGSGAARACRYDECGPPPGSDGSRSCLDNLQPEWICARDPGGACLWRADGCSPRCTNIYDVSLCSKVPGCFALIFGCREPRDPGSLCLRDEQVLHSGGCDVRNCPGGGFSPTGCASYVVDSCTLASGRYGRDCYEDVCRDKLIQVCLDPSPL